MFWDASNLLWYLFDLDDYSTDDKFEKLYRKKIFPLKILTLTLMVTFIVFLLSSIIFKNSPVLATTLSLIFISYQLYMLYNEYNEMKDENVLHKKRIELTDERNYKLALQTISKKYFVANVSIIMLWFITLIDTNNSLNLHMIVLFIFLIDVLFESYINKKAKKSREN